MVLHDTAEACCTSEYNWIDIELCTVRTDQLPVSKYWADKTTGKCLDDSVAPSENLDVQLFDTLSECCAFGVFWLTEEACFAASGVTVAAAGSNKFYIDWVNGHCLQDCEGPAPCGGLAETWDFLYDSGDACCAKLPWVSAADCISD